MAKYKTNPPKITYFLCADSIIKETEDSYLNADGCEQKVTRQFDFRTGQALVAQWVQNDNRTTQFCKISDFDRNYIIQIQNKFLELGGNEKYIAQDTPSPSFKRAGLNKGPSY